MEELKKKLLEKIRGIEKLFDEKRHENIMYEQLLEKTKNIREKVEKMKTPIMYSRTGLEKWVELYNKINDLENIVNKHMELTIEETYALTDEIEEHINRYVELTNKLYSRENLLLYTPIYTALIIYLLNIILQTIEDKLIINCLIPGISSLLIVFIALMLKKKYIEYSYILLAISATIGIFTAPFIGKTLRYTGYTLLIYVLIFATSITYLQTIKTAKSRSYREKIESTMNNILKITMEMKKEQSIDPLKLKELENKALSIFKKLHGDKAEELLRYKVNLLVMHGMRRDEALKKIISMYKDIIS